MNEVSFNIEMDEDSAVDDYSVENTKAMGGTELVYSWLKENCNPDLFNQFQIICSRLRKLEDKPRIFWVHDTAQDPEVLFLRDDPKKIDLFDIIVFVSHWQQQMYNAYLGVPYDKGIVIQHAIKPFPIHEKPRDGKLQLIYASTPHRGLEVLLNAFEMIDRDDVELNVYSSFKIYDRPHMDEIYRPLYEKAKGMKNVNYYGSVSNAEVREAMQRNHIMAYPSIYQETACITAIEALSAGLLCVLPNLGALPETCANFAWMYNYQEDKIKHAKLFASILNGAIDEYWDESVQSLLNIQKNYFKIFYSWENRIDKWHQLMQAILAQKK